MKNIVVLSNIEWTYMKQRHQFIAEGFSSEGDNVIYVESSAKRNPKINDIPRIFSRLRKIINGKDRLNFDTKEVAVITPFVMPSTHQIFNIINDLFFTQILLRKIRRELVSGDIHVIAYAPTHTTLALIDGLEPCRVLYDCVSNFEAVEGMPKNVLSTEKMLFDRSDVVTVDCDFLYQKHSLYEYKMKIIPPGVICDSFYAGDRDFHGIHKVCYFGSINKKMDFELLLMLKEAGIVIDLIGTIKEDVDLMSVSNIVPAVSHDELPLLISQYDALILPYVDTPYTKGLIPAKFFECFATGLPVISTKRDNFKSYFDYLITAENNSRIVEAVKNFKDSDDLRSARLRLAREHDWSVKIAQFNDLLREGV